MSGVTLKPKHECPYCSKEGSVDVRGGVDIMLEEMAVDEKIGPEGDPVQSTGVVSTFIPGYECPELRKKMKKRALKLVRRTN